MKFETLYKKSNATGKIEQWEIRVVEKIGGGNIVTTHGELNGKMQEGMDFVSVGKNMGKKNETSAYDQACAEAKSKWEKKLKGGYVKSLELAESGAKDELIAGGIEPMLAHPFEKQGEKIVYPCLAQPKLDGMRCIAIKVGNEVTLWTRTRKPITSCKHIADEIAAKVSGDVILDGELYNHEYKNDFEKIVSAAKKQEATEAVLKIQYHVYDMVVQEDFLTRIRMLGLLTIESDIVHVVKTVSVKTAEDVPATYEKFAAQGYEGAMLRNLVGKYEHRRSVNLIKVKKFSEEEFIVVGADEGRGKLAGHLGSFVVKNEAGDTFNVKMSGDQSLSKEYWENKENYLGQKVTVQFQGLTKYNIPRFPIGKAVRNYE